MHVQVLGPLRVGAGPDVREVTGRRPREVLAILLQRRSPVSAEALLELVGGDGAAVGAGIVHTWVARLRRQAGSNLVRHGPAGYQVAADVRTDADEFAAAVADARRLVASVGPTRSGTARSIAQAYRAALQRWPGEVPYANVRDDLVMAERTRLLDLRGSAVEELVAVLITDDDPASRTEALTLARPLADAHPLHEGPQRLLMLTQYHAGRPTDALQTYRDLRRRLRDELGVDPVPATADLHEAILRHELPRPAGAGGSRVADASGAAGSGDRSGAAWSGDPSPSGPPRDPRDGPLRGLPTRRPPAALTTLVGRDDELGALTAAVGGGRRLITLIGPGGVGKTRLLAELGHRLAAGRGVAERTVDFVELSGAAGADPAELAEAIAVAAGFDSRPADPIRGLVGLLGDRPRVVLLDEAERIADPLAALAGIVLGRCPALQVVVSSRRPLGLAGELVHQVSPLAGPPPGADSERARAAPSVALLADRLAERGIGVTGDAAVDLLARIARRLDGLPLALELAAGQAPGRSLAELAADLEPLDLPTGPADRRRDLRGVFGATLDTLDPTRRGVFHRLAVFAGPFEIADGQAVLRAVPASGAPVHPASRPVADDDLDSEIADAVRHLGRNALLQVEHRAGSVMFRMLSVVRELAHAGLDDAAAGQLRARHRARYADLTVTDGPGDRLPDRVARQVENYSEALRTAIVDGDAGAAFALARLLTEHWLLTGARLLAVRRLGELLDAGLLDPPHRIEILLTRARFLQHRDSVAVLRDTAEAIDAFDDPTAAVGPATRAAVLSVRALELWHLGDAATAVALADRAVLVAGVDDAVLAEAASSRALIHAVAGEASAVGPIVDDARRRLTHLEVGRPRLAAAHNVALALTNLGRFAQALALLDEVWPELPRVDGRTAVPHRLLLTRGWVRLGQGDPSAARADFADGLRRVGVDAADRECVEALLGIGCALADLDAPGAAEVLAGAGELMRRLGVPMSDRWRAAVIGARERAGHPPRPIVDQPSDALVRAVAQRVAGPADRQP